MANSVQITLIICATLIALGILGKNDKGDKENE